jgi:hypothetical protein
VSPIAKPMTSASNDCPSVTLSVTEFQLAVCASATLDSSTPSAGAASTSNHEANGSSEFEPTVMPAR